MSYARRLTSAFALVLALSAFAAGQNVESSESPHTSALPVTAAATAERVRFAAPEGVVQLRLEVYDESGRKLFDTGPRGGSVLDWHLGDGQGNRIADGPYLCVVTVKDLRGRLSRRLGLATVGAQAASVQPVEAAQLSAAQVEAVGPVEETGVALAVIETGGPEPAALLAHTGAEGQLTRTGGALSFRVGDFFAGEDREQMRLTEAGRLGLGTDEPEATLDVRGAVRATEGFRFADGTTFNSSGGRLTLTNAAGDPLPAPAAAGTGTQNRLAKWAETGGQGTLTDSVVAEANGNVGIGTTNPASPLTVSSTTNVSPLAIEGAHPIIIGFAVQNADPGSKRWAFQVAGSQHPQGVQNGSFIFRQGTDDLNPLVIAPTGNIGIGTSAPAHRLTIGQPENAQFDSAQLGVFGAGFAYAIARDTTNNVEAVFGADNSPIGPTNGSAIFGSLTNHGIQFRTNNILRMAMNPAGQLVIGHDVPTAKLTVKGNGAFDAPGAARFDLFNAGLLGGGFSQHVTDAGAWQLSTTGGTVRMAVNSSGNVGVGTTSPTAKLAVAGTGSSSAVGAARFDLFNTTAGVGYFQHVFNDGRWQLGSGEQTRILVDTAGNVGIGTGPTSRLTVNGEITSSGTGGGKFSANNPNNQNARVLLDWFNDGAKDWPRIRFGGSGEGSSNGFLIQGSSDSTKMAVLNNGNIGIGTSNPLHRLSVFASPPAGFCGDELCSVAYMENTNTNGGTLLSLRIDKATPNAGDEYIVFSKQVSSADDVIGVIEGNGAGGVEYRSAGSDYAEWLPRLNPSELIQPGEIVGLFGDRITKNTRGAAQVMAVSTGPVVLGNDPGKDAQARYEKVAFIGQVAVRVRGAVKAGDFIIASGLNDGAGVAVSPEQITSEQFEQAVGQAWESSAGAGVKSVRTAVGLIHRDPSVSRLVAANRRQAKQIAALNAQLTSLESRLNRELAALKSVASHKKKSSVRRAAARRQSAGAARGAGR